MGGLRQAEDWGDSAVPRKGTRMPVPARSVPLPKVLIDLTAVTGIVDVVAFLRLGQVFTAFMTGNILFLGFAAAGAAGVLAHRGLRCPSGIPAEGRRLSLVVVGADEDQLFLLVPAHRLVAE